MPDLKYRETEQDTAFNPAEQAMLDQYDAEVRNHLNSAEQGATDGGDTKSPNDTTSLSDAEQNTGANNTQFDTSVSTPAERAGNKKLRGKGILTPKRSIIGGGVIGIAAIGLLMLFTGSLSIVHLKEALVDDLNDQMAAMNIRSEHVLRAKTKKMTSGICTSKLTVKCRFSTMSARQIKKFEKAGFTDIETTDHAGGRKRITSINTPDGRTFSNPSEMLVASRTDVKVRSALNRAYNPLFSGFYDKVSTEVFKKLKTSRTKKVTDNTDEERQKSVKEAASGEKSPEGGDRVKVDDDGNKYILDENGEKIPASDPRFDELNNKVNEVDTRIKSRPKIAGKAVTGALTGALKGLSIVGHMDSACTLYNSARAVAASAKVIRAVQLAQFAMIILNTADLIKSGNAEGAAVSFVGTMLAATDTRKTIADESSAFGSLTGDNLTLKERPNPFYKKSAYEAPGIRASLHNDAPILTSQSQQYMVGGGLSGTLSGVLDQIIGVIGVSKGEIRSTCKKIQSPWTRIGGFVVGIGSFFVPIGNQVRIGQLLTAGSVSVALGFAQPFLEAQIADMLSGDIVGDGLKGVEAGDALFAGAAVIMGNMARGRGMQPASKKAFQAYTSATDEVKTQIAALEKYEARKTPFDATNQYSFLGSALRTMNPSVVKIKTGGADTIAGIYSLLSTAAGTIIPNAHAASLPEKYDKRLSLCQDEGYAEIGIDADVFCNVRYALTPAELAMDVEENVDYMIAKGHINEESGVATSDDYKKFLENCANRQDGWGETSEENGSIGLECIDGNDETFEDVSHFRVYTIDQSIDQGMEYTEEPSASGSNSDAGGENIPGNGKGIIETAKNLAYPYTAGSSGQKDAYTKAHKEHNGYFRDDGWTYTDCGIFVGTVMRMSVDPNFPVVWSPDQINYVKSNPDKYQIITNPTLETMQPGDIIMWGIDGGTHSAFYGGDLGDGHNIIDASARERVPSFNGWAQYYLDNYKTNQTVARYIGSGGGN